MVRLPSTTHPLRPETQTTPSSLGLLVPLLCSGDVSHIFWGESPGAGSFQLHPLVGLRLLQEQGCVGKCIPTATQGLQTLKSFDRGVGCCRPKIMQKELILLCCFLLFFFLVTSSLLKLWARQKTPGIPATLPHVGRSPQMTPARGVSHLTPAFSGRNKLPSRSNVPHFLLISLRSLQKMAHFFK